MGQLFCKANYLKLFHLSPFRALFLQKSQILNLIVLPCTQAGTETTGWVTREESLFLKYRTWTFYSQNTRSLFFIHSITLWTARRTCSSFISCSLFLDLIFKEGLWCIPNSQRERMELEKTRTATKRVSTINFALPLLWICTKENIFSFFVALQTCSIQVITFSACKVKKPSWLSLIQ